MTSVALEPGKFIPLEHFARLEGENDDSGRFRRAIAYAREIMVRDAEIKRLQDDGAEREADGVARGRREIVDMFNGSYFGGAIREELEERLAALPDHRPDPAPTEGDAT